MDTPGHANHHMSYLLDGICFSGDVGGVHIAGRNAVRLPTVPPEFDIGKWRYSINRFRNERIDTFATTHFGMHEDADWHLNAIEHQLDEIEIWMESVMAGPMVFSDTGINQDKNEILKMDNLYQWVFQDHSSRI